MRKGRVKSMAKSVIINSEIFSNLISPSRRQVSFSQFCNDSQFNNVFEDDEEVLLLGNAIPATKGYLRKQEDKVMFVSESMPKSLRNRKGFVVLYHSTYFLCESTLVFPSAVQIISAEARFSNRYESSIQTEITGVSKEECQKIIEGEWNIQRSTMLRPANLESMFINLDGVVDRFRNHQQLSLSGHTVSAQIVDVSQGGCSILGPMGLLEHIQGLDVINMKFSVFKGSKPVNCQVIGVVKNRRELNGHGTLKVQFIEPLIFIEKYHKDASDNGESFNKDKKKAAG